MPEPKSIAAKLGSLKFYRHAGRLAFLALLGQWSFYGIFRCPFPVPFVGCANCAVITCWGRITSLFWGFWLLLPLSALLFGRVFCSWTCPGGTVNQLLAWLSPIKQGIKTRLAKVVPVGFLLGLIVTLFLWLMLDNPRWAVPIRIGGFWQSVALTFEHADPYWLVRTAVVLTLTAFSLVAANFWCRWACPTGGLLEAARRFSLFQVAKNNKCNDCDTCRGICEMKTRPEETNCTNCGDCIAQCPQNAVAIGRKGK